MLNNLKRRALTLLLSLAMIITYMPVSLMTVYAAAGDPPAHAKTQTPNNDGTYKLELSVTGEADSTKPAAHVNVLVVYDTSYSMVQYNTDGTNAQQGGTKPYRADAAENILRNFAQDLFRHQDPNDRDNIEMALVTFASNARTEVNWTNNVNTFTANLSGNGTHRSAHRQWYGNGNWGWGNGNYNGGYTNWQAAMTQAQQVINALDDDDPTYVIFITDGAPTMTNSTSYNTRHQENYNPARGLAQRIQNNDQVEELYGIYAYGNEANFLDDLIYYAHNGADRPNISGGTDPTPGYYNGGSTEELEAAIAEIFDVVVTTLGITDVAINDGTTSDVRTSTGDLAHLLEVDTSSYQYWLSIPIVNNSFTRVDRQSGETVTYNVRNNGNGTVTVTWPGKSVTVNGTVSSGTFKYEWTEANALYNVAPPAAVLNNSSVDWDLTSIGTLLDKVTYSVTFDVYPSQETYDMIADLKNSDDPEAAYNALDSKIKDYLKPVEGSNYQDYTLATNTNAVLNWRDTREGGGHGPTTYDNPKPVPTVSSTMDVTKEWDPVDDAVDIDLTVTKDGENYEDIQLTKSNNWNTNINISTGLMRVKYAADDTTITDVQVLDAGHDYAFTEMDDSSYDWDLDAQIVRPMLIDSATVISTLVLIENPTEAARIKTAMGTKNFLQEGEETYFLIGNSVYNLSHSDDTGHLTASNVKRSHLYLYKDVIGTEPEGTTGEFEFTATVNAAYTEHYIDVTPGSTSGTYTYTNADGINVTIVHDSVSGMDMAKYTSAEGSTIVLYGTVTDGKFAYREAMWFSMWDYKTSSLVKDLTPTGWTAEVSNGAPTGYYYAPTGTPLNVTMTKNNNIRFGNVPKGTTYTFVETDMSEGYSYVKAEQTDTTGTVTDSSRTVKGTVTKSNENFEVTYTNQYNPAVFVPEVTKKVEGRNAFEAFSFSIDYDSTDAATAAAAAAGDFEMPGAKTATTSATMKDGDAEKLSFGNIIFKKAGIYKFIVKETNTTDVAGWTYDNSEKTITVTVTRNEQTGKLTAEATGNNPTFTNSFKMVPDTAQIPIRKVLSYPADAKDVPDITGEYTFTLTADNDSNPEGVISPMPEDPDDAVVVNPKKDGGDMMFGEIVYTEPGTYHYIVTEVGEVDDVINGNTVLTTTVTVTLDDDGHLVATPASTEEAPLTFTNTYREVSATINVSKELDVEEGVTAPSIKEKYRFTIEAVEPDDAPMPDETSQLNDSDAGGEMTFGPIIYKKPGTYRYKITETNVGDSIPGVFNDKETVKYVTVTVSEKGEVEIIEEDDATEEPEGGNRAAAPEVKAEAEAEEAEIETETVTELVTETVKEEVEVLDEEGNPVLDEEGNPVIEIVEKEVTKEVPVEKPEAEAAEEDAEEEPAEAVKAEEAEEAEEAPTRAEAGTKADADPDNPPELEVTVNPEQVTFTNVYRETTAQIPVEKILEVIGEASIDITGKYTFTLTAGTNTAGVETPMPGTTSFTNPDADGGDMVFGAITYKVPGTYTYYVTESRTPNVDPIEGIVDDKTPQKEVTVTVAYDNSGEKPTLTATVSPSDKTTFTNTFTPVPTEVEGTKTFADDSYKDLGVTSVAVRLIGETLDATGKTVVQIVRDAEVSVKTDGTAEYKFENLPKYLPDGITEISYRIEEIAVYALQEDGTKKDVTSYFTDEVDGFDITNKRNKGYLKITKAFGANSDLGLADFPDAAEFTITGPEDYGTNGTKTVTGKQIKEANGVITEEVPTGTYTVTESGATVAGYDLAVQYAPADGEKAKVEVTTSNTENSPAEMTVTNTYTKKTYTVKIVKKFTGIPSSKVPADFTVTPSFDGTAQDALTLSDGTASADGLTYTWEIEDVKFNTLVEAAEDEDAAAGVSGYTLDTKATSYKPTGRLTVAATEEDQVINLENPYTIDKHGVKIVKKFVGIPADKVPAEFTVTPTVGGVEKDALTLSDASASSDRLTYTWIVEDVEYNTLVEAAEDEDAAADVSGYTLDTEAANYKPTGSLTVADTQEDQVINLENPYTIDKHDVKIVKKFVGIPADKVPADFTVTPSLNGTAQDALELSDGTASTDGLTYTWVIEDVEYNTLVEAAEDEDAAADVSGYTLDTEAANYKPTGSLTVADTEGDQVINLENPYTIDKHDVKIVKKFVGIPADKVPADFTVTPTVGGVERDALELSDGTASADGLTYTWVIEDVEYNTLVEAAEDEDAAADVSGYTLDTEAANYKPTGSLTVADTEEDQVINLENPYTIDKHDVKIVKKFTGIPADKVPAEFTVTPSLNGTAQDALELSDGTASADGLTYTWVIEDVEYNTLVEAAEDVAAADSVTDYTLDKTSESYKPTGSLTVADTEEDQVINLENPYENTSYDVEKVWDDNDDQDGKRPESVTMNLYRYAGEDEDDAELVDSVTLPKTGGVLTHEWSPLRTKDTDGNEYTYFVKEVGETEDGKLADKDGELSYTVSYKTEDGKTTVTNKHVPEEFEVTVKKVWDDNNNQDGKRPDDLTVALYADNVALEGKTVTLTEAKQWTDSISGLPKYRDGGTLISYSWVEEDLKDIGYTQTGYVVSNVTKEGKLVGTITTITNKHAPEQTEAHVVKVWNDNDNKDKKRPNNVYIKLYSKAGEAEKKQVGNTIALNGENGWKYDWAELDKYEGGVELVYTVEEDPVPDEYTVEITPIENKTFGYTVTNSYQSEPEKDVFTDETSTTSIDGKIVEAGDELTYKIEYVISNPTSKEKATEVVITDTVPDFTSLKGTPTSTVTTAEGTAKGVDGAVSGRNITWTFTDEEGFENDTKIVAIFTVTVDEDKEPVIENTGHVRKGENESDTNVVYNSKPVKDVFEEGKMTTSIDGKVVKPGDILTYQITYVNEFKEEDEVRQIKIADEIPAHTEYVPGSATSTVDGAAGPDGTESGGIITWTFGSEAEDAPVIPRGTKYVVTFNVKVLDDQGTVVENHAEVQEGENKYETNVVTNSKPVKDVFEEGKMTTSIDGKVVKPGDILTYQVKYTNTSKQFVEKIDITDKVPAHTKYVEGTAKSTVAGAVGPDGTEADGTITWTFNGDEETGIAEGTEFVVTFNVEVLDDEGTVIENQAKVQEGKNNYETNIVTNSKPHKDVFEEGKMTTSIDGKVVKPGDILTYQIEYTNTSKNKVEQIDITDKVPEHTKFVDGTAKSKVNGADGPDGTEAGGTITWTFKDDSEEGIKAGTKFVVTFNVEVLDDQGTVIPNHAEVQEGENHYKTNEVTNSKPVKDVFEEGKMTTSIDGKVVKPGDVLTYQIKYTNTSKEKVEEIDITDKIPEHTKYVEGSAKSTVAGADGPAGTEADGTITWIFTTEEEGFAVGTEFVATFNVEVVEDYGEVIKNHAEVQEGKNHYETNEVVNSKPVKDVFEEGKMTTSIDGKMVKPGDVLTYQIKYTNTSKEKVEQIDITDKVPEHTKFVAGSAKSTVDGKAGPDGTESSGTITWTFKDDSEEGIAKGTEFVVTFNVEVVADYGELIKNHAEVQEGENHYDTNEVVNSKPVKDVFEEGKMTTSIDGKVVKPGDVLTYQVKYTNKSKEKVEQIDITDAIPEHTEYVENTAKSTVNGAAGPDGTEDKGVITWTFTGDPEKGIAKDTEFVVTFNVKVLDDKGTVIENQAKVNDGKNSSDTNIVVNSKPVKDVFEEGKMTTSIDGRAVQPGDVLTYQIDFVKTSKDPAEKVEITDAIPEHTEFVAGSAKSTVDGAAGPDGTEAGGTITWTFENADGFAVGTKFTATFNVKVLDDQGTVIENQSKVQEGDNSYDTNEVVNSKPVKDVFDAGDTTTSIDGDPVDRGQELTYSITYKNVSKEAQDVTITDEIPAFTAFVEGTAKSKVGSAAGPDGTESKGTITWAIGTVKPGEVVVATFNVIVSDEVSGETLVNDADVKEGKNTFKTNEVTNPTPPKKDVFTGTSTTSINGEEVFPGQELTYAITFENSKAEEVDVTITDVIPKYTTYVDGSADKEGKYDAAKNMITWETKAPAAKGGKAGELTVTFKVTVDPDAGGQTLKNEGTLREGKDGPEMKTNPVENPVTIELVITKDLRNFVQHEGEDVKATFGFKITGESAKRGAYSNVVAMEFTGAEVKELTVKGIPSDIKNLKVEEIVSGNYTPSTDGVKLDEKDGKYKVTFTNKYDDTDYKTGTINNYKRGDDGKYSKNGTGDNKSQKPTQTTEQPAEETQPNESGN